MNNNNGNRVNLNNINRPEAVAQQLPVPEHQENAGNAEGRDTDVPAAENMAAGTQAVNENDAPTVPAVSLPEEPQVPLLTIVRTFVLSFFSSIIPEAPAL